MIRRLVKITGTAVQPFNNIIWLLLCFSGPLVTNAGKYYVNDNSNAGNIYTSAIGNDANAGGQSAPFLTINKAIITAAAGDTIYVDAGTYGEQVDANKKITILGANAAISPNTAIRVAESILHNTANNSITITTASPVVIKGFRITTTFGNSVQNNTSNGIIRLENILFDGCKGTYFNAPDTLVLVDNRFNNLDTVSNDAVFLAGNYNGSTGTWLTAAKNMWANAKMSGMNCSNVRGDIYENVFDNIAYYAILVANYSSLNITRNIFNAISNPDISINTWGSGVRFYTPVAGMTTSVTNNIFTGNYIGVAVRPAGGNMSGTFVNINNNYFSGNTYAAIFHAGTGQIDASCNWLGLKTCEPGISATVLGPVDVRSYLNSGNDNDIVTPGFQPAPNTCVVPAVWTGNTNADWNTASNWSTSTVPGSLSYVTIPSSTSSGRMPVIASDAPSLVALNVQPGATLTQTAGTVNCNGAVHISGAVIQTGGTFLQGCTLYVDSAGTVTQSGTGNIHLSNSISTAPNNNVVLAANTLVAQSGGTIETSDITIHGTNSSYLQSGGLLRINRDFKNYGAFNATGGTIEWMGLANSPVFSGINQFHHVAIDSGAAAGVPNGANISVSGNYTSRSYSMPSGSTTTFTGGSAQNIIGIDGPAATFGNLVINKSADTLKLLAPANVSDNITISSSVFNLSTYTANRVSAGGSFTIGNGTALLLAGGSGGQAGSNYPSGFTVNSLAPTSTVIYNGSNAVNQTVYGTIYGNLQLCNGSGSGTAHKTSISTIQVVGKMTVDTGVWYQPSPTNNNSTY